MLATIRNSGKRQNYNMGSNHVFINILHFFFLFWIEITYIRLTLPKDALLQKLGVVYIQVCSIIHFYIQALLPRILLKWHFIYNTVIHCFFLEHYFVLCRQLWLHFI